MANCPKSDPNPFFQAVHENTLSALRSLFTELGQDSALADSLVLDIVAPPEFSLGQAALVCHPFSRVLKKSPQRIAEMLREILLKKKNIYISNVEAVNGYLNFFCAFESYGTAILDSIFEGRFLRDPLLANGIEKVLVEYSQPNTHKALHVGHLRNVIYGDAVCNLMEFEGHQIVRATYPGDLGAHIAKTLWYIRKFKMDELPSGNANWLGEIYAEADLKLKAYSGTSEEPIVRSEIAAILSSLQARRGEAYELYLKTRKWSLDQIKGVYGWLGVCFDVWFFESDCDEPSRELVLGKLNEGFFIRSQGAVGIDLSEYDLGFAMYLKTDGNGLYLTKDLELVRLKFEDPEVTRSIVIVDSRQKLHFRQLFKTAELMGYPQAARSLHLSYESVTTSEGVPFSSRSKNGLPLEQLRKDIEEKVIRDYLSDYKGKWTDDEIFDTARMIALGALKYGMLKVDPSSPIRFVLTDWLRLDGDTGPYLQYTHARCCSVIEKMNAKKSCPSNLMLTHVLEQRLLILLGSFRKSALQASQEFRPSVLAGYLHDLCKVFNYFYKECSIKAAENEEIRQSRLALVISVQAVLKTGLGLLGISAPSKM